MAKILTDKRDIEEVYFKFLMSHASCHTQYKRSILRIAKQFGLMIFKVK
jgi:hypothetical protein